MSCPSQSESTLGSWSFIASRFCWVRLALSDAVVNPGRFHTLTPGMKDGQKVYTHMAVPISFGKK